MPQVSVTIAGHTYRMACNEGEEKHLQGLAQNIDERIRELKQSFGEIGDQRITVMAAITVADELSEAKGRVARLETQVNELRGELANHSSGHEVLADQIADSLGEAAVRIERAAQKINESSQR